MTQQVVGTELKGILQQVNSHLNKDGYWLIQKEDGTLHVVKIVDGPTDGDD